MSKQHNHSKTPELSIFHIPADVRQPMTYKTIDRSLDSMRQAIGGGWIEVVRTKQMPLLGCLCRAVMVADEEGLLKQLMYNPRGNLFYPRGMIVGDVFLVGEGPVDHEDDFFSLPPAFRDFGGGRIAPVENRGWVH